MSNKPRPRIWVLVLAMVLAAVAIGRVSEWVTDDQAAMNFVQIACAITFISLAIAWFRRKKR